MEGLSTMISTNFANTSIGNVASRPRAAASGKTAETETGAPGESVELSKTEKSSGRGFFGSALAKTGVALAFGAALFCAGAPAANAQSVYYYPQPVRCVEVQVGQQSGIMADRFGNVGVYTTTAYQNSCTGIVTQQTVGVGTGGVTVQQQQSLPNWGVYQGPSYNYGGVWNNGHWGHGHHHHHHRHGW